MRIEMEEIRTEAEYERALGEIDRYFDAPPERGTPEADRFDVLAALLKSYEDAQHPIVGPDAA